MTHTPNTPRRIDPVLLQFQGQADVQRALDAVAGTKVTKVSFMTKSGKVCTRAGMLNCHSRRKGGKKGAIASKSLKDAGNIWMDYSNKNRNDGKKGFSFNLGRVIAIGNELGTHPE